MPEPTPGGPPTPVNLPRRPGDQAELPTEEGGPGSGAPSPKSDRALEEDAPGEVESIRTGPFEQVLSLCEAFSQEWAPGTNRRIDSYLDRVGESAQSTLLRNLLFLDVERRRAAGEQPSIADYLERFPQFASLIRDAFVELSTGPDLSGTDPSKRVRAVEKFLRLSDGQQLSGRDAPPPEAGAARRLPADRLGDYRLLRELGRGGMGVVYEAVHVQRGNRVALKTLPVVDGAALHRFKREFRALADVNHPNLIGLHALEADGAQWFFTMDLVEGTDFLSHVRPGGVLDAARLRAALGQLATGVLALHARHIIHRDLKPSNVMVGHDGRVVVLDFGLVLELDSAGPSARSAQNVAGTPRYMAPEQAAAGRIVPASDWYAVGVMLYEALAGRAPFRGPLLQVLQAKQRLDAPPLPDDGTIPADLGGLCRRLLGREPQQRPDTFTIVKAIASGIQPAAAAVSHSGHHLVGREQHLAALQDAYRTLERQREPLTVFISGRSGEGKTALAEHFVTLLRQDRRLAVMSGRCYDRESVPFKALDALIDALGSYLRSLPKTDAALLMPDDIGVLALVFPALQRVEVVARASDTRLAVLDEQQVRQRAFRALRSLLSRISRRALVVWFVDDLQWGDADSAEALFEVLRPPEAPALLFLGTYRSDETEGSAFLKRWQELQRKHDVRFADREVKVAPLTVEECTELVVGLLGKDNDRIRRRAVEIAQETRGNPFLLVELVGCFDPDTDSFEPVPLHEVLARKLGRLPAEAGYLLEVVAVSGQALSLEEASRTAGHALPPVATITRMRNERLVRLIGSEECPLVDTYHDRVREAVLGDMNEARCKILHLTLAEVIEYAVGGVSDQLVAGLESGEKTGEDKALPRVYDLAYHYDAAGEKRKAWVYALLAAEQARRQSALDVATQQYAIAKRNAAGTTDDVRYRIAEGHGEALMLLGRYEEANQQLHGAIDLAEDPGRKAQIEVLQGEILFRQGLMAKSSADLEQGLRRLGNWVPKTLFGFGYGIVRELLVQCGHCLMPSLLHRQSPSNQRELALHFLIDLPHSYAFQNRLCSSFRPLPRTNVHHAAVTPWYSCPFFTRTAVHRPGRRTQPQNTIKWLWAHLSGMNRAELVPPSPYLVGAYAMHSVTLSMLGWRGRGVRYGDRALVLAREFDDLLGEGQACYYHGIGLHAGACYEDSIERLCEAIRLLDKAGDQYALHLAHFHKGCCHYGLGDLAEAVAEARGTFASSARLGDSRVFCSSYLWARATRGNFPFEELRSCYPYRPDDVMSTVHGIMAEGHWQTFHGRTAEALQAFERAGEMIRKTYCVNSHMIVLIPELAGALRRHADALQARDAQQAEQLRKRAYRVAKWATRLTWLFPAAYPLALRERSLILAAYGKTKKALKYADKSCAVAEAQKAKYEHAQSRLVRGKLAKELGLPEADEQIRTAEAALEEIERPVATSMPARATLQ